MTFIIGIYFIHLIIFLFRTEQFPQS